MMFNALFALATFVVAVSAQTPDSQSAGSDGSASANAPAVPPVQPQPGNGTSVPAQGTTPDASNPAPGPDTITAHPDPQCQDPLDGNADNQFSVTKLYPDYHTFPARKFLGAEPKDNTGGWDVWWSMPENLDQTCRYIIMLPYTTDGQGLMSQPPGIEIINTGQKGRCYFSKIPVGSDIYMTKCCGDTQCGTAKLETVPNAQTPVISDQRVSPGQHPIIKPASDNKAPVQDPTDMSPLALSQPTNMKRDVRALDEHSAVPQGGSLAARAKALVSRFWYPLAADQEVICNSRPGGTSYTRAGKQVIVSQFLNCPVQGCSVSISYTQSYSTTITSSHEVTLTNGMEASITVEAGVDFIEEAKLSTTVGYSFSKAIADATGQEMQSGDSVATAYSIPFIPGQPSVVTFTPYLRCWTASFDCGAQPQDSDFCSPILIGSGDQAMVSGVLGALVLD